MPRIQVPSFIAPAPRVETPDGRAISAWVIEAFAAQGRALQEFENVKLTTLNTEPIRPRDGMLAFADGVNWNPGSGVGTYEYKSGWVPLFSGGGGGGGLNNVVEDTSPTLGGDLEGGGFSVGTVASPISGLFFSSGAAIDWGNGDVTVTHTANALTVAGGEFSALVTATGGNTQRTLADHFADVIHAKDYGVVANGSTDDTAALQAAFNAIPVGGTLVLPPGVMKVIGSGSACLTITTAGFRIVGNAWGSNIQADSTVPNTRDIIVVAPTGSARGFFFSDFRISNNSSARHALAFITPNASFVYNIHVDKMLIDVTAGGNSINHLSTGTGLGFAYSTITRCNLESIKLTFCADGLTISENTINGEGSNPGIYVECVAGAGLLVIDHNVITGTAGQIVLDRSFPLITDNYLEQFQNNTQTNGAMIDIQGTSGAVHEPKIINNLLSVVSGITGVTNIIRIDNAIDGVIDGNRFGLRSGGSNKHILLTANATRTRVLFENAYFTDDVSAAPVIGDSGVGTLAISLVSNTLLFAGASSGYLFSHAVAPLTNDGAALGSGIVSWSDLYLASGGAINWNNGTVTVTQSAGFLSLTSSDAQTGWQITCANSGAQGPQLVFFHESTSPAVSDAVATLSFVGRDSGNNVQTYGFLNSIITNPTSGAETSQTGFSAIASGSTITAYLFGSVSAFAPGADDLIGLGASGVSWSDLYLASGGVINWNSGNYTITHSSGKLTFSGIGEFDGQLIAKGTATNDSAASGDIGEIVESEILVGSAVSLTSGAAANVTSISLTAGDWDVWGNVVYNPAGTTTLSLEVAWISTTSATLPTSPNKGAITNIWNAPGAGNADSLSAGMRRISVASTTTVYLGAFAVFAVSTCSAYGYIGARRVR